MSKAGPVEQRRSVKFQERLLELDSAVIGVTEAEPVHTRRSDPLCDDNSAIVLLHGFTGRRGSWKTVVSALARHCRVVALDLPGHGDTKVGDDRVVSLSDAAILLEETLAVLAVDGCTLIGYSLGGRLALNYVLKFPGRVQRLVLEGVRPGLAGQDERAQRRRADNELAEFVETCGLEAFVDRWQDIALLASQRGLPLEVREGLREERLSQRPRGLAASLRGMGVGVGDCLESQLPSISAPVLLISGEYDQRFTATARSMSALLPRAVSRVVSASGHNVHLERPAEFIAAVSEFVGFADLGGDASVLKETL